MEILKQFVGFSGSSTEVKVDLNLTLKTFCLISSPSNPGMS